MNSLEFKEKQEDLGLSNKELAKLLCTSQRAIEEWRSGRNRIPGPISKLLLLIFAIKGKAWLSLEDMMSI